MFKITQNPGRKFTVILVLVFVMINSICLAADQKKVAVIPFAMNTQDDLGFLQKGIFDMLSSRLAYGDEVQVLSREQLEGKLKTADPQILPESGLTDSKAKALGRFSGCRLCALRQHDPVCQQHEFGCPYGGC